MASDNARELLLAALRLRHAGTPRKVFETATSQDWLELAGIARAHRISALLYWRLKEAGVAIPPDILQQLQLDHLKGIYRNTRRYHYLARILERFHHARIPVIPLKGAYLAQHIYDCAGIREMSDIDLLVRKQDLIPVHNILLDLGYAKPQTLHEVTRESCHFSYRNPADGLCVEVHYDLIAAAYGIHTDIDSLWERSRETSVSDVPVREMSPEDQILHLCVHSAKHVFNMGLRAMYDLTESLRRYSHELDWPSLFSRARQWGSERCVYVSLRLAGELLNAPVPDDWPDGGGPKDIDRQHLAFARECLFLSMEEPGGALPTESSLVELWTEKSMTGKLLRIWRAIFISRQGMAGMYPALPNSLRMYFYYPLRVRDILMRHGKYALRLLAGEKSTVSMARRQSRINALRNWLLAG